MERSGKDVSSLELEERDTIRRIEAMDGEWTRNAGSRDELERALIAALREWEWLIRRPEVKERKPGRKGMEIGMQVGSLVGSSGLSL